jgi:hypothetical protein
MARSILNAAVIDWVRLKLQGSKPSAPASGYDILYTKTGGLYIEDSGGTETGPMMANPMNAAGDIIVGGTSGAPERLAKGSGLQVLRMNSGGTAQEWATPASGGGNYIRDLLSDTTLASAGALDISNLAQTYDHLELIFMGRSSRSSSTDGLYVYFNNDTTNANYRGQYVFSNSTTSASSSSGDEPYLGFFPAASATAGYFGIMRAIIPFYTSTVLNHMIDLQISTRVDATTMYIVHGGAQWESTTAINRLKLYPVNSPNTWEAGSRLQIFGLKSA